MKQKQLILILGIFLFTTGCTATYELEIYNKEIQDSLSVINTNPSTWQNKDQNGDTYQKRIEYWKNYPFTAFYDTTVEENDWLKLPGVEYYTTKSISNSKKLGLEIHYSDFKTSNYNRSTLARACYQYLNLMEDPDTKTMILATNNENKCFDYYSDLEELVIRIKTNHKVVQHNADQVDRHTYIWKITRENFNKKNIQLEYETEQYVFNYDNQLVKIGILVVGIGIGIAILSKLVIIIFRKRRDRINKV